MFRNFPFSGLLIFCSIGGKFFFLRSSRNYKFVRGVNRILTNTTGLKMKQYKIRNTVNKFTPQAHSPGDKPYLISKYLHTLTCTRSIGIGYHITTDTYPPDSTRAHK